MKDIALARRDIREISLLLKQAQHRKQKAVDDALGELQCSLAQWVILRRIAAHPGASAHALAQSAFQTDQAFGAITRRLIDRGLVIREQGKGRATAHRLSSEGERLLEQSEPIVRRVVREEFSGLDDDELEVFGDLLAKIVHAGAR
ncbi:MAG TPA: MarR family transcriptional regulator [Paracoccaceae bacterium]|nr:MarR family transcriptional regulator [Paracoccaceae bacterium]